MQTSLQYFTGFSLIDITSTGVIRGNDSLERNQQRNWESVLQTINLISQPFDIDGPRMLDINLDYLEFGEFYQGQHNVWVWSWCTEHSGAFSLGDNPAGRLEDYFNQVPIIAGLTETSRFILPIFYSHGAIKNVYFKSGLKDISNI